MEQCHAAIEIAHADVPGRLRLRIAGLRGKPDRAARLAAALAALPEIVAAEPRPTTGSLILRFEAHLTQDRIIAAVRHALDATSGGQAPANGVAARASDVPDWHGLALADVLARLGSDVDQGLTAEEARQRLRHFGHNLMPREEPPSSLRLLARQFRGLPVLMLAGSSAVSLATGGVADAAATLAVVALNGVLGFVTEGQAERTIHSLVDTKANRARAIRDGTDIRLPASELVPGDMIVVTAGCQVAADARLVTARGLRIDESTLTGESRPVAKDPAGRTGPDTPIGERKAMLYAGTIVAEGSGRAVVVATGARTEAARIQRLSATGSRPQAPVEAELDRLGARLALASLAACGLFVGLGLLRGYRPAPLLKDALALAVAAVPEGLPVVATTTMSRGLRKLERRGILIRQMSAIESLGALQTVCLDKTGTLTQNRMTVTAAVAGTREVGLDNTEALAPLASIAALNNDATIDGGVAVQSSQTEQALLAFALGQGLDIAALRNGRPRRQTLERTPDRPWMATLHDGARSLAMKGAPEAVLARSSHVIENGVRRVLTEADRGRILEINDRIASRPARVLAFAEGEHAGGDDPQGLTFLGLLGMTDPLRPGAGQFVRRLHRAGIETVLITGDQSATAHATARELDLARGGRLRTIDAGGLAEMDPELLAGLARETHVFARVASHEKLAIVKALQASGRVVGMTGDGVNDGPALAAADVGIAMGESGADLARDVANVVIADDRLETLAEAIAEGRAIHRNIRRALEFLITTNMSEIAVAIAEAVHGPGELETPMEFLWINLVTDVLPGLGLALAEPDRDVMDAPPRPVGEPIVPRAHARRMAQDSGIIAASALLAHFVGLAHHGPGPHTRGMTFLALSQAQLLYTLVCQRSDPRHLRPGALLENHNLDLALLVSSALGALPFVVPPLGRLLGLAPLRRVDLAVALGAATLPLAAVLARRGIALTLEERET
jgi:Ca2+-transporting ATPase